MDSSFQPSVAAIIPARGGSKGIPQKNLRPLAGKPLIAHSILSAMGARHVQNVYVTTDSADIAQTAAAYGATVIHRPEHLASDTASSESALLHAIETLEAQKILLELVVFLQCTSPLRTSADIDRAVEQIRAEQADSLLSVSPCHRFLWQRSNGTPQSINYDYRDRQRRQDIAPQYVENGSIYVFKPWVIKELNNRLGGKIALYEMTEQQSWDIDTMADLEYVDFLLKRQPG
jgi:N-acylneuraminate cytidylyltransferase